MHVSNWDLTKENECSYIWYGVKVKAFNTRKSSLSSLIICDLMPTDGFSFPCNFYPNTHGVVKSLLKKYA